MNNAYAVIVAFAFAAAAQAAETPAAVPDPQAESAALAKRTDALITAQVQGAILTDPSLTGADISVNTSQGVVNLTGNVKSREQAAIASSHAQRPDGVMRIEDHLAVNER